MTKTDLDHKICVGLLVGNGVAAGLFLGSWIDGSIGSGSLALLLIAVLSLSYTFVRDIW